MKRKVTRGTRALFEELFLDDDGTPLFPMDASKYPAVSVLDPNGVSVQDGLAVLLSDGRYQYSWFVPADADLNTSESAWTLRWVFLPSQGNRTIERSLEFDVIDSASISDQERGYTYLVMQGTSERLFTRFRLDQEELTCCVTGPDGHQLLVAKSGMQRVDDRGEIVYYFDTPALGAVGDYLVVWRSRQTVLSAATMGIQMLRVPESSFYYVVPSLRMLIDKTQKRIGLVQSYSDSDMYEYLRRGVDVLNVENPITHWTLGTIPHGFDSFVVMAAAEWGLAAQYVTEELRFSFSGQTTTLDSDRSAIYDAAMTRIRTYLDANLQKAKVGYLRSFSMSHNANRPYDFGLGSFIVPIQQVRTGQLNVMPLLSSIGLI